MAEVTGVELLDHIDDMLDRDPLKLREALVAALKRLDAEVDGARRQMAKGDYRLCPPDMLRLYVYEDVKKALGLQSQGAA